MTESVFRLSAQELLECSFLAVEPDVVILENDPSHTIVTLQVVFKGSDKLSVKFEFNTVIYNTCAGRVSVMRFIVFPFVARRYG